jgi:hypothetical protein
VRTIARENPSAGMGTVNYIPETLDICAGLNKVRKQSFIDCSGLHAEGHHTGQHAAVTA